MIKKIGIIFLVIVLLWSPLFPIMNSMAYTKKQVVELTHAPEFYGTTAIRVPVGTKIDVKTDARFRIFARDLEDGDLTSQIVVTKNTVQTNKVGNYQISYQVTDTNHHTTKITVPVSVVSDITEIWMEKTMYTLPNLEYLEDLGYYRGNHQDRQMIGLYLEPGGSFEMRKTSGQQPLEVNYKIIMLNMNLL